MVRMVADLCAVGLLGKCIGYLACNTAHSVSCTQSEWIIWVNLWSRGVWAVVIKACDVFLSYQRFRILADHDQGVTRTHKITAFTASVVCCFSAWPFYVLFPVWYNMNHPEWHRGMCCLWCIWVYAYVD